MRDHAERAREILNDLIEYTGKSEDLVRERCKYSTQEMVWHWDKYKDNPLEFYRDTDLYIFDLTKYQSILVPTVNYMVEYAKEFKIKKVLDLGGGIGEYTLRLSIDAECEVTYLDLKGSKTRAYAQWRFGQAGIDPKLLDEDADWHSQEWDAVVAMDVLEHMEKPIMQKALEAMRKNAKYIFCNPDQVRYNEIYPQHITRFTLEGFERVDLNLYRNKALKTK